MIEVGCQGDEAFGGETAGDVLDVVVETPPFLDDDDRRCFAVAGRAGQIPGQSSTLTVRVTDRGSYYSRRRLVDRGRLRREKHRLGGTGYRRAGRHQHAGGGGAAQSRANPCQKIATAKFADLIGTNQLHCVNAIHRCLLK